MTASVSIPILGELAPGGFRYGTFHVVEFDPDSLWYETSVTIAAKVLRDRIKTEYVAVVRPPSEVRDALGRLGLDPEKLEDQGLLRITDLYTNTTILTPQKRRFIPISFPQTGIDAKQWMLKVQRGYSERIKKGLPKAEKRWLLINENSYATRRYLSDEFLDDFALTAYRPWFRAREMLVISSGPRGIMTESQLRRWEARNDGVIDFAAREVNGKLVQSVRVRKMRGVACNSDWHALGMNDNGEVSLTGATQHVRFEFNSRAEASVFDHLAEAFLRDYMVKGFNADNSGWRSLVEVARGARVSRSSLYGDRDKSGQTLNSLLKRGLIERRLFPGERGRGGTIARIRIRYEKDPVKEFVDERLRTTFGKSK